MKLFLSSAGIKPETKQAFLNLIDKEPRDCKVAFIPTACDPEPDKSYVQWTIDQIKELGITLFNVDLKDENELSLYEKLSKADIICVNGGNTFYLLDWIKKSGFDKVIKKLITEGKIYFGVSAGSYIVCPTIEVSTWKGHDRNTISLTDLSAMNLVNFLIFAHYEERYKVLVENSAKTTKYPIITLTNQQAIVINENNISLAGPEPFLSLNNFSYS